MEKYAFTLAELRDERLPASCVPLLNVRQNPGAKHAALALLVARSG